MKNKSNPKQRGFVILVVLAAAVVITAVVATQAITSQQSLLIGIRASEEVRARAIAESCLSMVSAAVELVNPVPAVGDDYDAILAGPNGATPLGGAGDADDFVPFGARVVSIPTGAAGALNRWELITIGAGVCAVRFDDNGDDGRLALPGNTFDDADEGQAGSDIQTKDRDRSIYVTAIGIFPMLPGTADAQAYDLAHARVTLRRALQRVNVFQPLAPAVWAGSISAASNVDICGLGGVNTTGGLNAASNTCFCGQMNGAMGGADPPLTGDMCAGCPSTASLPAPAPPACVPTTLSPALPQAPATWVHWADMGPNGQNDREGWSSPPEVPLLDQSVSAVPTGQGVNLDPGNDGSIVGGVAAGVPAPFCAFYGDAAQQAIFVWDGADVATQTTLEVTLGGGVLGPGGLASIPQHDCSGGGPLHNADPLPPPCDWNFFGAPPNIDCSNGGTPCWKLQAYLMGVPDAEVGIGPITAYETSASFGDEEWHPHRGIDLIHVTPGRYFGTGANRLCGDNANNCANCSNGPSNPSPSADNVEYAVRRSNSHFHFDDGMNNEYMPSPSVWIFDANGEKVHLNSGFGSGSGPWRATIITNNYFDWDGSGTLCCATCDCATAAGIGPANCGMNDLFGRLDASVQTLTVDADTNQVYDAAGRIAIKSRGDLDLQSGTTVIGDIRAGSIDLQGNNCVVGNVIGYKSPISSPCNGGGTCNDAYVCMDSNIMVNGDVHSMGDIYGSSNVDLYGNLVAKDNICLASNSNINGAVIATNAVELASNIVVVSTTSSTTGMVQNANTPVTTYMEASW